MSLFCSGVEVISDTKADLVLLIGGGIKEKS